MQNSNFDQLVEVMRTLRSDKGCPWDKEQTLKTLKPFLVEECYEVWEAIDENNPEKLKEELGDLLFQIIFYAQVTAEQLGFNIYDVIETIKQKMIRRHPHVFGEVKVKDSQEVLVNWEEMKKKERGAQSSALDGVPKNLPALLRAHRIQEKAARVSFEWENIQQCLDKLGEEGAELREALQERDPDKMEEELGDVLFALVNVARFMKINPEEALQKAIGKFIRRFQYVEAKVAEQGKTMKETPLEETVRLWKEAKENLP
jgi:tetrapyrrole methylase family protein/MazG family protein